MDFIDLCRRQVLVNNQDFCEITAKVFRVAGWLVAYSKRIRPQILDGEVKGSVAVQRPVFVNVHGAAISSYHPKGPLVRDNRVGIMEVI